MDKKKQYYKKDKKAQVYKRVKGIMNEWGDHIDAYRPIASANMWCYSKQLSQDQKYIAKCLSVDESRLFVFNFRKDIAVYDRVLYRDTWYEVTRVDTRDDYNTELYVYVKDCPFGDIPSEDEVLPYVDPSDPSYGTIDNSGNNNNNSNTDNSGNDDYEDDYYW